MTEFLVGLLAGALGTIILAFLGPIRRLAERISRTLVKESPIDVLVDRDQAVIWAGAPPWVGASYFFEGDLPESTPPPACFDWSKWVESNQGYDYGESQLLVTIQAKLDVSVVVDPPIVRVIGRREANGVIATCPAGGASLTPRRFDVELDGFDVPTVAFNDEGLTNSRMAGFSLTKDDVEQIHIWARTDGSQLVEWSLEMPLIVNGKRSMKNLGTFITVGSQTSHREFHRNTDGGWSSQETPG